jgi:hypothetical protein
VSHQGFLWTTNSGSNFTVYADTGVQHVAMKGDGSYWLTVGTGGIKYSLTQFSGTLTQGSTAVTTLVQIIVGQTSNRYYACTTNAIYSGTC